MARHRLLLCLCAAVCMLAAWSCDGGQFDPVFPGGLQTFIFAARPVWGAAMLLFLVAAISI